MLYLCNSLIQVTEQVTERVPNLINHDSQQTLRTSSTWNNARVHTSDQGLSHPLKGFEAFCMWLDRKHFFVKWLHFQLVLNTLGFLSVTTDGNLKDWDQANMGAAPRKLNFCCFDVGNSLLKFVQPFWYTRYIRLLICLIIQSTLCFI